MKCFIQTVWEMPSAGAVASEREREQATERELWLLRLQHEHVAEAEVAAPAVGENRVARPPLSDSSSSEGEALAAAVTALGVLTALPPHKDGATTAREFLAAVHAHLPYSDDRLLSSYLDVLHSNHCTIRAVTNDVSPIYKGLSLKYYSANIIKGSPNDKPLIVGDFNLVELNGNFRRLVTVLMILLITVSTDNDILLVDEINLKKNVSYKKL